jgi:hypothetical protein
MNSKAFRRAEAIVADAQKRAAEIANEVAQSAAHFAQTQQRAAR